jgi:peptidoglycan/LPS O-acetylase OafA/YrhL
MSVPFYRPDIDGLRAVAVLSVVAYHVAPVVMPSGFLGVDVFFVISGFLITSLVRAELEAGTFSFLNFYGRRIRRIYPALLIVLLATLIGGTWLMLPEAYYLLGQSALWAATGLSNFYFLSQVDYFAPSANSLPLLHTWSLGVEEQFYLLWPLLMATCLPVLARLSAPRWWLPLLITIASFVAAVVYMQISPDFAFYSPITRAWELGLGATLAFAPNLARPRVSLITAAGGLLLILVAVFGLLPAGAVALSAACLGAGLIVWPRQIPAPILRAHPLRFVGLISYSLYLWHWPLLVLLTEYYLLGERVTVLAAVGYFAALAVLSVLTWAFIEQPARRLRIPPVPIIAAGLAAAAMLAIAGWQIVEHGGWTERFPHEVS